MRLRTVALKPPIQVMGSTFLQRSVLVMTNSPGHGGHPVFAPYRLPAHNRMPRTYLALRGRGYTDIDCQPPGGHGLPWGEEGLSPYRSEFLKVAKGRVRNHLKNLGETSAPAEKGTVQKAGSG